MKRRLQLSALMLLGVSVAAPALAQPPAAAAAPEKKPQPEKKPEPEKKAEPEKKDAPEAAAPAATAEAKADASVKVGATDTAAAAAETPATDAPAAEATPAAAGTATATAEGTAAAGNVNAPATSVEPASPPAVYVPLAAEIDHSIPVGYVPGWRRYPSLGLNPLVPSGELPLPGGVAPSFASPVVEDDWTFKFTGYLESALAVGIGKRNNGRTPAVDGQKEQTLHTRAQVPDRYGSFEKTIGMPGPWVQLNFNYGNPTVQATAIVAAFNQSRGASYVYQSSQLGIAYAYLSYTPEPFGALRLRALAGTYADRYGSMARWSEGKYGVSLIGAIYGAGETVTAEMDLSPEMTLTIEEGFKANLHKAPVGVFPDPSNAYADQDLGSTLAAHVHAGLSYKSFQFGAHLIHAWEQDDRFTATATPGEVFPTDVDQDGYLAPSQRPNGRMDIYGLDVRFIDDPMHHFYAGAAYVDADSAASLNGLVTVMNASGGEMLREEWFGKESGATGQALILGFEYDVSLFKLFKQNYRTTESDLTLSLFSIFNKVNSKEILWVPPVLNSNPPVIQPTPEQAARYGDIRTYDGLQRLKFGAEVNYNWLSWLGFSARADRVIAALNPPASTGFTAGDRSHTAISPRVIFYSDFYSREQVVLSYSHWFYGDKVFFYPNGPNPPSGLDSDVFAISGNMYW